MERKTPKENSSLSTPDCGHVSRPPAPPLAGLDNLGTTCYLNSLIQTMYFTPGLRQRLFALGKMINNLPQRAIAFPEFVHAVLIPGPAYRPRNRTRTSGAPGRQGGRPPCAPYSFGAYGMLLEATGYPPVLCSFLQTVSLDLSLDPKVNRMFGDEARVFTTAVVAPTGYAASRHKGGKTLHSFLGASYDVSPSLAFRTATLASPVTIHHLSRFPLDRFCSLKSFLPRCCLTKGVMISTKA